MIIPFSIDLVSGDLCMTTQTLAELKRATHLVCRDATNEDLRTFCGFNPSAVNFKFKLTSDWGEATCRRCRSEAIEDEDDDLVNVTVQNVPMGYTSAQARGTVKAGQMVAANPNGTVSAAQADPTTSVVIDRLLRDDDEDEGDDYDPDDWYDDPDEDTDL